MDLQVSTIRDSLLSSPISNMDPEKYAKRSYEEDDDVSSDVGLLKPTSKSFKKPSHTRTILPWILHFILLSISGSLAFYAWKTDRALPVNVRRHAQIQHEKWGMSRLAAKDSADFTSDRHG